jgi:signal transduction histidine kinase
MSRKKDAILDPISAVPLSGPHVRASDVVFQKAEQPSHARPRPESSLPPAWGERLLRVAWETPLDSGDEPVLREMLSALSELLPALAVGASCVRTEEDGDGAADSTPGRGPSVLVVRRLPAAELTQEVTDTVARVFPELSYEASVSVPANFGNVTLHIASEGQDGVDDSSLAMSALRRAILLLARNLDNARTRGGGDTDTEAKRVLAAQVVQADKLSSLGQIAAGMVHELNNPLTSIVAYSEYLVKRWLSRSDQVDPHELERLQRISDSANRLLRFTRDLVTYARPATDPWMPISVHTVIDQAVIFCEHLLSENKTTVVRSYCDTAPSVVGSPQQLTQVFVNLFTNACQAMAAGGAITVTSDLENDGRSVRIVVQDAGHGIDAAHLGQVFSPFFTTKAAGRGTGLGLSIVKTIIDAHQGRIWAESEPQQGARFIIVLPC